MKNIIEIKNNCALMWCNFRGILYVSTTIDLDDVEKLQLLNLTWRADLSGSPYCDQLYIMASAYADRQKKLLRLHRVLCETPENQIVDHVNGDTLDNRKSNLKNCNSRANGFNRHRKNSNNTSGFRGVSFDKSNNTYRARVGNRPVINLGSYNTAEEAAAVVQKKLIELGFLPNS